MGEPEKKLMMKVESKRFGEMEYANDWIYTFPEGILGFPDIKQYFLIENPGGGPFQRMHAMENPDLAFVICDPLLFLAEYEVAVRQEDIDIIHLEDISKGVVLVILTIPVNHNDMTANLQGPLVFNPIAKMAKQFVLNNPLYPIRYRIFEEGSTDEKEEKNAGID